MSTQLERYKEHCLEILGSFGLLFNFHSLALKHCFRGIVVLNNCHGCVVLANKYKFCTNISPVKYTKSKTNKQTKKTNQNKTKVKSVIILSRLRMKSSPNITFL